MLFQNFQKSEQHYVEQVKFETVEELKNAILKITRYFGRPATTTDPIDAAFVYLSIEPINFKPEQIKNTEIKFLINKSWLLKEKILPDDVVLKEFKEVWNNLPTKRIGETGTEYIYRAQNASFSYFSIGGGKQEATKEAAVSVPAEKVAAANETTAANISKSAKEKGEFEISATFAVIIVAAIVLAA